jgi:DNA-binding beta-propeller fold protein YncE
LLASFHIANQIAAFDIDPSSPTYHTQIAGVTVAAGPNDLAITPDGARVYVGHDTGVDVFDVGGIAVVTLPVPGIDPIGDVVITPDGSRAYVAKSGTLYVIDIDSGSPTFHVVTPAVSSVPVLQSANLAVTPDGNRLVVAWFGVGAYSVAVVDIDPASPTFHTVLQTPVPLGTGNATQPATSYDGSFAFVGNTLGNLARINFTTLPIGIDLTSASLSPDATLVPLDDEQLLVLDQGASSIPIADPNSLLIVGNLPWNAPGAFGAITPDGQIAYLLRNALLPTQELVAVPLE